MGEQSADTTVMDQVREHLQHGHGVFFRSDPQTEFTMHVIPDCRVDDAPMVALAQARDRNRALAEALGKIAAWQLPTETGFWWDAEHKRTMSYQSAFGSQGVRGYIQRIATAALHAQEPTNA